MSLFLFNYTLLIVFGLISLSLHLKAKCWTISHFIDEEGE